WRVNFARNEIPHNEASSWAFVGPKFHTPSKFGGLIGMVVPSQYIGTAGMLTPKFSSASATSAPVALDRAFSHQAASPDVIIPEPVLWEKTRESFRIDQDTLIVIPEDSTQQDIWAADSLNREIQERGERPLKVVQAGDHFDQTGSMIVLGEPWRNRFIEPILKGTDLEVTKNAPGSEGYALVVQTDGVAASGSDPRGTFYAVQSMRQILRKDESGLYLEGCRVYDWPRFAFRGVHLLLDKDSPEVHGKMIEDLFARYKVNAIVFEIEQGYQWESHPEIASSRGCDRKGLEQLLDIAERNFIQTMPLVQTLGHLEFIFKAHPDLVEDPEAPYAYCPLNPKSYQLMFDLLDEAIEVFRQPKYVHIGHDEFDMRGTFPAHEECRKLGKAALYEMDTLKLYEYLQSKGVGTMMWGDILLEQHYTDMMRRLPKDILITDWHYAPAKEYPSVPFFTGHRLDVLCCPWNTKTNITSFSQYASAHNAQGMLQTTWTGYFGNAAALQSLTSDLYCYILGAEYAWTPDKPELEETYVAANAFQHLWYDAARSHEVPGIAVDLFPFMNLSLKTDEQGKGWLQLAPGHDLAGLPTGQVWLKDGIQYRLRETCAPDVAGAMMMCGNSWGEDFPSTVFGIPVHGKSTALNFLHATVWTNDKDTRVGAYVVHYDDGSQVEIPLRQGKEVFGWLESGSSPMTRIAWLGTTARGSKACLHSFRWINPSPDRKIETIDVVSDAPEGPLVVLAITAEVEDSQ
ncbi:MAG TPA: glycoside hydrolase family 20 zincin-like fold domain-containing protein, partial [bacterium]|nr:glycoside hydrolase family 20 zincin-like fold domain-containing protein [bacterium]